MKIFWPLFYFASTGLAWYLGQRERPQVDEPRKKQLPRDYLLGLNFLINDETDKAVDIFIKMLEVDSETVETHLAVGKLFRRRGEVDRAIRIHQNLIARPQLEKVYRDQSLFELGQDYLSAGVLDRAERIFQDLINDKSHAARALNILIDIYQQEKEWEKAIQAALKYESITKQSMHPVIAHYYCELAESALQRREFPAAISHLEHALVADRSCARASLLFGKVYMEMQDFKTALRYLKKIREQNPDYLAEAIDQLASCYEKLNQGDELEVYLRGLLDEYPRVPVVLILAERIRQWKGDKVAASFVADYVRRYPSLHGLHLYINLHISSIEGRVKEDLRILQNLVRKVLKSKPNYRCHACGFSGKTLHWQCPGCRQWGVIKPIQGLDLEAELA